MNCIALIPARYASTRFPGKLMQMLGDKTVIRRTYDNTVATALFDQVMVVTDSEIIYQEMIRHGANVKMSSRQHESGTDRLAEAVENMAVDVIVNVQGDEPFVQHAPLQKLLQIFRADEQGKVQVASLMREIKNKADVEDPNFVKVVVDRNMNSLLFSRSKIPFPRDPDAAIPFYEHVGVYAYRKQALLNFTRWPVTPLEAAEKIECLRYLEHGVPLKMVVTDFVGVEIDTPEDLRKALQYLATKK